MVADPDAIPVTTPVEEPTAAIAALLLLQVPPEVASPKVVVFPTHTTVLPVMALWAKEVKVISNAIKVRCIYFIYLYLQI
jgi:hypothetical protein